MDSVGLKACNSARNNYNSVGMKKVPTKVPTFGSIKLSVAPDALKGAAETWTHLPIPDTFKKLGRWERLRLIFKDLVTNRQVFGLRDRVAETMNVNRRRQYIDKMFGVAQKEFEIATREISDGEGIRFDLFKPQTPRPHEAAMWVPTAVTKEGETQYPYGCFHPNTYVPIFPDKKIVQATTGRIFEHGMDIVKDPDSLSSAYTRYKLENGLPLRD